MRSDLMVPMFDEKFRVHPSTQRIRTDRVKAELRLARAQDTLHHQQVR